VGLYRVGRHDVLDVSVYGEGDLSLQALRVSGDGYIPFPLLGRVHVEGMTPSQIEEILSRKLAQGDYLLDAQVSVNVKEYNSQKYSAFGEIKNSGTFPLKANERLMDAISSMGGVDFQTAGKKAIIIRTEPSNGKPGQKVIITVDLEALLKGNDPDANILLFDQDVIYVPQGDLYYMIGEVHNPGSYRLPEKGISLVEAIGTAGGFTNVAARNRTRIVRVEDSVEKIITVNVDSITDAGRKIQDVTLKPGDIIVVPESFF
jgi:protein involved in polysaccharide export with SLBB domain